MFLTFDIPHFFEHDFSKKRRKRETTDNDMVNYGFILEDVNYHIQMWPNHGFLSPNAVFETRSRRRLNETKLKSVAERQLCHFTGYLKGHPGSRVALSTCDGLVTHFCNCIITNYEKLYQISTLSVCLFRLHKRLLDKLYIGLKLFSASVSARE